VALAQGEGIRARLFVELDLEAVTARKAGAVAASAPLLTLLRAGGDASSVAISDAEGGGMRVTAPGYRLAPCDLSRSHAVLAALDEAGIDRS